MSISRQLPLVKIVIDQNLQKNVDYFNYLGSMMTNNARRTCEIRSRIVTAKLAFTSFRPQIRLKFK